MGAALDPGTLPGAERLCVLVEAFQTSSRLLRERELWVSSMPPGAPTRENRYNNSWAHLGTSRLSPQISQRIEPAVRQCIVQITFDRRLSDC